MVTALPNKLISPTGSTYPSLEKRCRSPSLMCRVWWIALVVWWGLSVAHAHQAYLTVAQATIEPDGGFHLVMQFDTLAFALNDTSARIGNPPMEALLAGQRPALEAALAEAKGRFAHGLTVTTDRGVATLRSIDFPGAAEVSAWKESATPVLPVVLPVRVVGQLPPGATSVTFRFPAIFDQVILTLERPGEEPVSEPVETGTFSTAWPLRTEMPPQTALRTVPPTTGPGFWGTVGRYVEMGFRHILPEGLDHILFVLGLFLLNTRLGSLLAQVTAFTVAHSITLGLSLYGVVRLPGTVVEPLIALSIVIVAIENLRTSQVGASRLFVVFAFGLMHGLGFAAALNALGLPRHDFFRALMGFNVGVELGQLAVVALAYATLGLLRDWPRYRQVVVHPCSLGIAAVASYWTVQRVLAAVHP